MRIPRQVEWQDVQTFAVHQIGRSLARGRMLAWHTNFPERPLFELSSEGVPSCCCWYLSNSGRHVAFAGATIPTALPGLYKSVVFVYSTIGWVFLHDDETFAGTAEGAIYAWNTKGFSSCVQKPGDSSVACLRPDYSTESAPDHENTCSIVAISTLKRDLSTPGGASFPSRKWNRIQGEPALELICLSAWGHAMVWLVKDVTYADAATLEQADWGLRIGKMR